jgi:hypothetical protein
MHMRLHGSIEPLIKADDLPTGDGEERTLLRKEAARVVEHAVRRRLGREDGHQVVARGWRGQVTFPRELGDVMEDDI